jgi:hypothetical protein
MGPFSKRASKAGGSQKGEAHFIHLAFFERQFRLERNKGTAEEQRAQESRVKQRASQKDVPNQGEKIEGSFSSLTLARLRILCGFPRREYRQIEREADHED